MSLEVGITGGIGAGKTLIANIFRTFGIPIYNSDEEAKRLMNDDEELKGKVIDLFGRDSYSKGVLNRTYLTNIVFKNQDNLSRLNAIVHPAVYNDYSKWLINHEAFPITIKEAALLFESGSYKDLDYTILVSAPRPIRIRRVLLRDMNRTKENIEEIIDKQMSDSAKKKLSYFNIINDGQRMVIPQVLEIYQKLLNILQK